jgi:hypothetical protein
MSEKADFEQSLKRASHFVKIIVACPHRLPKLPESTLRKQARPTVGHLLEYPLILESGTFLLRRYPDFFITTKAYTKTQRSRSIEKQQHGQISRPFWRSKPT